jgi:hypothetical protein
MLFGIKFGYSFEKISFVKSSFLSSSANKYSSLLIENLPNERKLMTR